MITCRRRRAIDTNIWNGEKALIKVRPQLFLEDRKRQVRRYIGIVLQPFLESRIRRIVTIGTETKIYILKEVK